MKVKMIPAAVRAIERQKGILPVDKEARYHKIAELKEILGYKKDTGGSRQKRERRAKIRELAGNDAAKIMQLKERLYNDEEKGELSGNRYPLHKGYSALFEQYGKDECCRDFFSKLAVEGNNIIFDNKKFSMLAAGHNGIDIFGGGYKDRNGETGLPGVVYMSGNAATEQAAKQGKKLFATRKEANSFIQQFP